MSDTVKIGKDEVLAILDKAVEEKGPDFNYQDQYGRGTNCTYFEVDDEGHRGAPACLVGTAFHLFDPRLDDILWAENGNGIDDILNREYDDNERLIGGQIALTDVRYEFTPDAVEVLMQAQSSQDVGIPWGNTVERARGVQYEPDFDDEGY